MEKYSRFQFTGFKVTRSLIERYKESSSNKISLSFKPEGIVDKKNNNFQLKLGLLIVDNNKSFRIEIESLANYHFENTEALSSLNDLFFINAPALLFPYIRAYISTLTNLSGFEPINIPTLNMSKLGEDLKENIKEI